MKAFAVKDALCAAVLLFFAAWAENASSQEGCPFAEIYANPMGTMGAMVACEGKIEKAMSISFPIGLIMKTEGYAWYAEIFKLEGIRPGAIREGNSLRLKGQYIGRKKVLFDGSVMDLPMVFVTEVD